LRGASRHFSFRSKRTGRFTEHGTKNIVELPDASESGAKRHVRYAHIRFPEHARSEMGASGLSDCMRRNAEMFQEKPAHVAFTNSEPIGEVANGMLIEESISNEPKRCVDCGCGAVPRWSPGRCLGPASLAWPKSRLLGLGCAKKKANVLAFRRPCRADWSAVHPCGRHCRKELAVKSRVSGLDNAVADVRVQLHGLYILFFS